MGDKVGLRGCKYLGERFEHLAGCNGIEEWRNCKYPVPPYVNKPALPMGQGYCEECKVGVNNIISAFSLD